MTKITRQEISEFFKSFFKDCWWYITFIWTFFGVASVFDLLDIIMLDIIDLNYIITIIFYLILFIHPFFIYGFFYYEKKVEVVSEIHKNRDQYISKFLISQYSDTLSLFRIKNGKRLYRYYLIFNKFSDIEMNFSVPSRKNFRVVNKTNPKFWIIKCKIEGESEYYIKTISFNKSSSSFTKLFEIFYSKKNTIEKALKHKKKIKSIEIFCR